MKAKRTPLWTHDALPTGVCNYLDAYCGEFSTDHIRSGYPYSGPAKNHFRRISRSETDRCFERFDGHGAGCWTLRRNDPQNDLTADLLAAAEILGGEPQSKHSSAGFGGGGVDSGNIWIDLLDGGVGVQVILTEHATSNRVAISQSTTIRGAAAYRALLQLLGFDWLQRKLKEESVRPKHQAFIELVEKQREQYEQNKSDAR